MLNQKLKEPSPQKIVWGLRDMSEVFDVCQVTLLTSGAKCSTLGE